MTDEWRPVPNWPYECTIDGRVRHAVSKRIRKPCDGVIRANGTHYRSVGLSDGPRTLTTGVHRVVASAWIGPIPDGMEVNHIDGNKLNNHASNLEFCTRRKNQDLARIKGDWPIGERHGSAKLSEAQVREIRARRKTTTRKQLAKEYGLNIQTVTSICAGKSWKHVS